MVEKSPPVESAELLAAWRRAEERLYPMVMVIPENYERVVRLVGATTVELQLACPDLDALVAEAPRVADRVRRLAEEEGAGDGLDYALIGSAACLMRYRQIETETRREQRIHLIEAAAAAGRTWVTLAHGAPATSWPPLPSTTVEMHLASGRALQLTTGLDESTGASIFAITEVALEPETGDSRPGQSSAARYTDRRQWEAATDARRREIELGH